MGLDLYIRRRGESIDELDKRESADHFGYNNSTMAELGDLGDLAGAGPICGMADEEWIAPERAAKTAARLRAFLADVEPGQRGSVTDEQMCEIAAEFASFCERAAAQKGFVVW